MCERIQTDKIHEDDFHGSFNTLTYFSIFLAAGILLSWSSQGMFGVFLELISAKTTI